MVEPDSAEPIWKSAAGVYADRGVDQVAAGRALAGISSCAEAVVRHTRVAGVGDGPVEGGPGLQAGGGFETGARQESEGIRSGV